jgi:putative transposase
VLNYVVTSNHVHILVWVPRMQDLSHMMHWLQGTFATDCNRRQQREGAFWRGRFHPTLVQTGNHFSRCLFYVDMNMVRAGVISHPRQWRFGGHHELTGERQRYQIIDRDCLNWCLDMPDATAFTKWYNATLEGLCHQNKFPREPYWSEAFAVGERPWLRNLLGNEEQAAKHITAVENQSLSRDEEPLCVLNPPLSLLQRLWHRLGVKESVR